MPCLKQKGTHIAPDFVLIFLPKNQIKNHINKVFHNFPQKFSKHYVKGKLGPRISTWGLTDGFFIETSF